MPMSKSEKPHRKKTGRKNRAAEIANTFEWLITAFILAFVFRAFVMEAFRIPTGSMADTLKGAHFRLRCRQCGYKYDRGFDPRDYRMPQDSVPRRYVEPPTSRCPSCGCYRSAGETIPVANGDRILVLKCIYQFFEPKRWDVVVFKNPLEPGINYIKRLVARPGETLEIIDGDVYINGQIARKPAKVQDELWMPVYDNDYQPVRPQMPVFNRHRWQQPFRNSPSSKWQFDGNSQTVFRLDGAPGQTDTFVYDSSMGNDFRAAYAYNNIARNNVLPLCSDLMVRFYANFGDYDSSVGIGLSKYQTNYEARLAPSGEMVISQVAEGNEEVLQSKSIEAISITKPTLVKFANVDHQLVFEVGGEKLVHDFGRLPEDAGQRETGIELEVKVFGSGKLTLSHIAIFRDIHYTAAQFVNNRTPRRAAEGNPFTLGKDEFFMLGDNSPNSQDSRWWNKQGIGNNGRLYRQGIVPRDYLVGKALFVYWPSGFRLPCPENLRTLLLRKGNSNGFFRIVYALVSLNWIPNVGELRFIYGGSDNVAEGSTG